ncbi:GNAT family N-acetyltransferase [Microbacterium fluvii]|uniref:GNAT family N-acetyltransferase n=1 Tax=Microbacterium fluvii TaxID=415215 RepID=A0ABW2HBD0_9MICO|nr:GNAT family N-acetyltransferase [Microbacterium fluvii]MCU4672021.1 GNAT family N-acetyltransferase [Microbacterium fluvii]
MVRDLRLAAVGDPDASIAFLTTLAEESARDERFWRERTESAADSVDAAQFVAIVEEEWVATATVLVRAAGTRDHLGHEVTERRADVVGVYVDPAHRGHGWVRMLFDRISSWVVPSGVGALHLDVHAENARAQAAYRRAGFAPTGRTFTGPIGPELETRRDLTPPISSR